MAPGARSKCGAPVVEPEVFRKQIYCIEESACDIVATFRLPGNRTKGRPPLPSPLPPDSDTCKREAFNFVYHWAWIENYLLHLPVLLLRYICRYFSVTIKHSVLKKRTLPGLSQDITMQGNFFCWFCSLLHPLRRRIPKKIDVRSAELFTGLTANLQNVKIYFMHYAFDFYSCLSEKRELRLQEPVAPNVSKILKNPFFCLKISTLVDSRDAMLNCNKSE